MAGNMDCIYLGEQFKPGIGFVPVCGFTAGPAVYIDQIRPICGNYKTERADTTGAEKEAGKC